MSETTGEAAPVKPGQDSEAGPVQAAGTQALIDRKTELEIAKLGLEIEAIQAETRTRGLGDQKTEFEISKLSRELKVSRRTELFLPAFITGLVLAVLVPVANWFVWTSQKKTEFHFLSVQKRMDTYSELANHVTHFTQVITLLNMYKCDQARPASGNAVPSARTRCDDMVADRFQLEPKLVKTLRDVKLHFSDAVANQVNELQQLYNGRGNLPMDGAFVEAFREKYRALSDVMRKEIQQDQSMLR